MNAFGMVLIYVFAGTLTGAIVSLIPSLHVYNAAGLAVLIWMAAESLIPPDVIAPFFLSMVVAFAFINTLPMTLIGAADESATATILPNQKYLLSGRGYEAVAITTLGAMIGIFILAALVPAGYFGMPYLHNVLSPHMHWILMAVIFYMVMSEWPKGEGLGTTFWQRFSHAWGNLFAGLITFLLSGLLGMIVTSRTLVAPDAGFQNIMPVFVGLFAIPSAIQQIVSRMSIPKQFISSSADVTPYDLSVASLQGTIAGSMAAYLPAVTAGIGSIIAGHMVARRGDKIFIISGGIAKVLYYVGAFTMLYFISPLLPHGISRGGLSTILKPVLAPARNELLLMTGVILLAGGISCLMTLPSTRIVIRILDKIDYRRMYYVTIGLLVLVVLYVTGLPGLALMAVASCIGSIPVFFSCRRSNCMAVLLVPIAINMAGYGPAAATFLGLD